MLASNVILISHISDFKWAASTLTFSMHSPNLKEEFEQMGILKEIGT